MSNSFRGSVYRPFSVNQMKVLTWWHDASPVKSMGGLIADGAIRSGKTFAMGLSFVFWAMAHYDRQAFALCGRTQGGVRRNLLIWLLDSLRARNFIVEEHRSDSYFLVRRGRRENRFYLFGGQNEASQALIQGMTLAGALFDEVALMPESFVNQATGRCSVAGAKLWFNCNPQGPFHWFKCEWIDRAEEKGLHYIHFTMDDNPSLTPAVRERYQRMYTGAFYKRYILGLWEIADGAIYDRWDEDRNTFIEEERAPGRRLPEVRWVGVDYGTTNPMVFLDARFNGQLLTILDEYYYDSKKARRQKTDSEYADDFERFVRHDHSAHVVLDPSAASFRQELRRRGYRVRAADNRILEGIRVTSTMIAEGSLRVHRENTPNLQRERATYAWNEKARLQGEETPKKENDHAMDALRYLAMAVGRPARRN